MASNTPQVEAHGLVEETFSFGRLLVSALPPAFLMLVLINIVFLGLVMWFLNSQLSQRTGFENRFMQSCMDMALHMPPPDGSK